MSRERKIGVVLIVFALCALFALFLFPLASASTDGVHESLKAIKKPFRTVAAESYLDGGSIGLRVVDAESATHLFALPVNPDPPKRYTTFFPGALYLTQTNRAATILLDKATKRYFCYLLECDTVHDGQADVALMGLRGAPRDYLPLAGWFLKGISPFEFK